MALFGKRQKKDEDSVVKTEESSVKPKESSIALGKPTVLLRPHVTEKAAILTDFNVYAFVVSDDANKFEVKSSIKETYNKTPSKIRIARKPNQVVRRRGGLGSKKGYKKAYVYMKKGETLDIL